MLSKENARLIAKEKRSSLLYDQEEIARVFCDQFFQFFKKDELGLIAFYWPLASEADPRQIAQRIHDLGGHICLPVVQQDCREMLFVYWEFGDELISGNMGIMVPNKDHLMNGVIPDTIIVPLLAINSTGQRIGFGRGHYDASIKKLRAMGTNIRTIGLAYDEQILDLEWETNIYDVALDYVCSPTKVITF